jgi:hypothetical protein
MMTDDDHDKIMQAVRDLQNHKPPEGAPVRTRGVPRHNNKTLYTFSVNPKQAKEYERDAREAGFTAIQFDENGRCKCSDRRQEHEYAYYREQYVNLDGGYFETIRESRKRELDRLAGRA